MASGETGWRSRRNRNENNLASAAQKQISESVGAKTASSIGGMAAALRLKAWRKSGMAAWRLSAGESRRRRNAAESVLQRGKPRRRRLKPSIAAKQ